MTGELGESPLHDYNGTPLHDAALRGSGEVVQALLNAGANVHAVTKSGQSPLHNAASNGHEAVVRALLSMAALAAVAEMKSIAKGEGVKPDKAEVVAARVAAATAAVNATDKVGLTDDARNVM